MDFNIITFHRAYNYGAVLQTLGLQEFIKKNGYSVGVLDYTSPKENKVNGVKGKILNTIHNFSKRSILERVDKFNCFVSENLNLNKNYKSKVFITGSDQVWNPSGEIDENYFLKFCDLNITKASYAASLGVDSIPVEKKEQMSKLINDFDKISVRESNAKEIINSLLSRDISVNLDPTLLHSKEFWRNYAKPVDGLPKDYILVYLMHYPKNINRLLGWLEKELKAKVVIVDGQGAIQGPLTALVRNNKALHNIGPDEFLWLVDNAKSVVTTSFHGTAFSVIFEKEFYSLVSSEKPNRISNLLDLIGLNVYYETQKTFNRNKDIDWKKVKGILEEEVQNSKKYIDDCFKIEKSFFENKTVSNLIEGCYGCTSCEASCPKNAIKMIRNREGFYEPSIDEDKCVNCGICVSKCPQKHLADFSYNKLKSWYGWHNEQNVRNNSTSGGAFQGLCEGIIAQGGVVYGAVYADDFKSVMFNSSDFADFEKFQKSKYIVSKPEGLFNAIKTELTKGRKVLICAAPCQISGLVTYLGKDYENLITVDFVCGGMPSESFWQEHVLNLENKYESKIKSVDFRSKKIPWGKCLFEIEFENGKTYARREFLDIYYKLFIEKISVRDACLSCGFHSKHFSDITIADFWGYRAAGVTDISKGLSLIIANTEKGASHIENAPNLTLFELDNKYSDYAVSQTDYPKTFFEKRKQFFDFALLKGFEKTACEQHSATYFAHLKKWLKMKLC